MNQMNNSILEAAGTVDITELPRVRLEAKQAGITKYYTGKPCHAGHITYRYTNSGLCFECGAEKSRVKYKAGWRQDRTNRPDINRKWNKSDKAKKSKLKWRNKDPKRAWAVIGVNGVKARAALKGVPFDIDYNYILSIAPDECPVFGTPFSFLGNKVLGPDSATLDRLDPIKGYVRGNIAVISHKANMVKSACGSADIQKVADWLRNLGY
jgi:hypothetical protein